MGQVGCPRYQGDWPGRQLECPMGQVDRPTRQVEGKIDELSLYGRALTGTEIAAVHSAGANGKCRTSGTFPLGALASGGAATLQMVTVPPNCVTVSVTSTATAAVIDPSETNNWASVSVSVAAVPDDQLRLTVRRVSLNNDESPLCC